MMFNYKRKSPSPFLVYTEVGDEGSCQLGNNECGIINFAKNKLKTESGISKFVPPGCPDSRLGSLNLLEGY